MARVGRESDVLIGALIAQVTALQSLVTSSSGFSLDGYHKSQTQIVDSVTDPFAPVFTTVSVTAAAATDLPTTVTLANQLRGVLKMHLTDTSAHLKSDSVNDGYVDGYSHFMDGYSALQPAAFGVAQLVLASNILNVVKIAFNAHRTQSGVHVSNDNGNVVSTANATDLASAEALAIALKAALNLHMGSGPASTLPKIQVAPF